MTPHDASNPTVRRTPRSYGVAILMSAVFGFFGGGEWYLGNRRLAILLLVLMPFGAPGIWFGLIRAALLVFLGPESFELRYGASGSGSLTFDSAPQVGMRPRSDSRWEQAAGNAPRHAAADSSGGGVVGWQREEEPREALIAGRLSVDAYLEQEARATKR